MVIWLRRLRCEYLRYSSRSNTVFQVEIEKDYPLGRWVFFSRQLARMKMRQNETIWRKKKTQVEDGLNDVTRWDGRDLSSNLRRLYSIQNDDAWRSEEEKKKKKPYPKMKKDGESEK